MTIKKCEANTDIKNCCNQELCCDSCKCEDCHEGCDIWSDKETCEGCEYLCL